jgi:isoquinoline 1-oxidoreductase alpha subunit
LIVKVADVADLHYGSDTCTYLLNRRNRMRKLPVHVNLVPSIPAFSRRLPMELLVNDQLHEVDVEAEMPLLWVLRDILDLKGTKYSCGIAQCGACTVHIDGEPVRSCVMPVSAVAGKRINTIEALAVDASHPLQQAWIKHQVPQCGYCQSGQIMAAAALLQKIPQPTDADINAAMSNICRCGTYVRIRAAIHDVAGNAPEVAKV